MSQDLRRVRAAAWNNKIYSSLLIKVNFLWFLLWGNLLVGFNSGYNDDDYDDSDDDNSNDSSTDGSYYRVSVFHTIPSS